MIRIESESNKLILIPLDEHTNGGGVRFTKVHHALNQTKKQKITKPKNKRKSKNKISIK